MGIDELKRLIAKVEDMEKQIHELQKKDAINDVIINQIKSDLVDIKLDINKGFVSLSADIKSINEQPKNNVEKFKNAIINAIGSAIGAGALLLLAQQIVK